MNRPGWILIDGYNLLYASGVFGEGGRTPLESSREALLDWLGEVLSESQRKRTTIVFDAQDAPPGLPRRAVKHHIKIRFAARHDEADDLVEELIGRHTSPRSLTVVSSDHRLHRAARRRRAVAIDSEQWVNEVRGRRQVDDVMAKPQITLDEDELRDMLGSVDADLGSVDTDDDV